MKLLKTVLIIISIFCLAWKINTFLTSKLKLEWTKERLATKNPTEYVFNHPIDSVKKVIEKNLKMSRMMSLRRVGKEPYYGPAVKGENTKNDYVLSCSGVTLESYLYRTGDRGRYYFIDLQIHLDSLNNHQTLVKMITLDPRVISGYRPGLAHMSLIVPIFQPVEPSTIEEYQVIYKIGKTLGENMPLIIYPIGLDKETLQKTYYGEKIYNDPSYKKERFERIGLGE